MWLKYENAMIILNTNIYEEYDDGKNKYDWGMNKYDYGIKKWNQSS